MRVFYNQIWCTNYFCLRRKLESYLPSNDECLREIEMAEDKEMHAEALTNQNCSLFGMLCGVAQMWSF